MKKITPLIIICLSYYSCNILRVMYVGLPPDMDRHPLFEPDFEEKNKAILDNQIIRTDGTYQYQFSIYDTTQSIQYKSINITHKTYYCYLKFFRNGLATRQCQSYQINQEYYNYWDYDWIYEFKENNKLLFHSSSSIKPQTSIQVYDTYEGVIDADTIYLGYKYQNKLVNQKYVFTPDSISQSYPNNKIRGLKRK